MRHWNPDAYAPVVAVVPQLAASGLIFTPNESDLASPLSPDIAKFYQGANLTAPARMRLFRLAWDLTGTQFGSRQTLYERFLNGVVAQLRMRR